MKMTNSFTKITEFQPERKIKGNAKIEEWVDDECLSYTVADSVTDTLATAADDDLTLEIHEITNDYSYLTLSAWDGEGYLIGRGEIPEWITEPGYNEDNGSDIRYVFHNLDSDSRCQIVRDRCDFGDLRLAVEDDDYFIDDDE